jgi:hypothetical protein
MPRMTTRLCVGLCIVLAGCNVIRKPSGDPTVIPPEKLRTMLAEDRERLAGPDSARHLSRTYFGVDVTGEGPFEAIGHIVWALPNRLIDFIKGDTPLKYATLMEDTRNADNRRASILKLAGYRFARRDPYTKRYSQIGSRDSEYLVRAAAIRALNHSRSKDGAELFMAGLDDAEPAVRLEAAKALANVPVEAAVSKLITHLRGDENRDVRIACADALREIKTLDVARALIGVLSDRDFGVSWQARKSLNLMTGRDFRYDESAWLNYVSTAQKPLI